MKRQSDNRTKTKVRFLTFRGLNTHHWATKTEMHRSFYGKADLKIQAAAAATASSPGALESSINLCQTA
jgi:hypothetical protein